MATKAKRKKSRPHKHRTAARGKVAHRRKRSRGKRKSRMGDVFTHAGAKKGLKSTGVGALGGLISLGVDLVTGDSELLKGGVSIIGSFVAAAMDAPNLGAGMIGGYAYGLGQRLGKKAGFLSDDFSLANYVDKDSMSDYPDALTEDGKALYLAEDGDLYLSDEFFKQPDGTYVLADDASPYDSSLAVANYQ